MPMIRDKLSVLNARFAPGRIEELLGQLERFAPGKPLDAGLLFEEGTPLFRMGRAYLAEMPKAIQESINAVIRSALETTPPTNVTFAWAPAYDWELTVWSAACGITVLIKSRYADDKERDAAP